MTSKREELAQQHMELLGLSGEFSIGAEDSFAAAPAEAKGLGETALAARPDLATEADAKLRPRISRTSDRLTRLGLDVWEMSANRYILYGEGFGRPQSPEDPALVVDPTRILVDTELLQHPVVIPAEGGRNRLVLSPGPKAELEVLVCVPRPASKIPPPPPPPPLNSWLEKLNDPWLKKTIETQRAAGGQLAELVATGCLYRHRLRSSDEVKARVTSLLAGKNSDRELDWAQTISGPAARAFEEGALAWAERLHEEFATAREAPDPEDESWSWWLRRVLHEREELEGVRALLRAAKSTQRLNRALKLIDDEAYVWIRALPVPEVFSEDEMLQRVALLDHTAWWAHPAELGELAEEE
jgi:hypothetical protein